MESAHSAYSDYWGWGVIKPPGPSCRSCAQPWCGQGGIVLMVRSKLMRPMWEALSTAFVVAVRTPSSLWRSPSKYCRQRDLAVYACNVSTTFPAPAWFLLSARRLRRVQKFTPTGGKATTAFPNKDTGTARSTFPAAEIRHTFPCLGCIALLRCSNDGCSVPTKGRLHRITWTPISTNSLSASIADTLVVEACSSSGYCNTLLSPHRRGTGRRDLSPTWKTTICRGHCT